MQLMPAVGAEALLFRVTDEIKRLKNRQFLKKYLSINQKMTSYDKYLAFRGIMPVQGFDGVVQPTTQLPLAWRDRKTILALTGSKCKHCGTPQYPPQRICVNPACGHVDEMEPYSFAEKKAKLFSFTEDHASRIINPPLIYGIVDFAGGGRFPFDLTDCEAGNVKTGMELEMTLRRKYLDEVGGIVGYMWKAKPVRQ
jgi:hydroxymethylglutaryl-CoA synthase